ncbi:hypothetical protein C8Q76DRAFT_113642 [Earliella scabrosa]|nr:hypothetical protein C8Q76DRAFT_113642 [Earliella scabrosa]
MYPLPSIISALIALGLVCVRPARAGSLVSIRGITNPDVLERCAPSNITWLAGGQPPFFLVIFSSSTYGGPPLRQFSGITETHFTWNTDLQAGTMIGVRVIDAAGRVVQSVPALIQPGPYVGECPAHTTDVKTSASSLGSSTGVTRPTAIATTPCGRSTTPKETPSLAPTLVPSHPGTSPCPSLICCGIVTNSWVFPIGTSSDRSISLLAVGAASAIAAVALLVLVTVILKHSRARPHNSARKDQGTSLSHEDEDTFILNVLVG